MSLISSTKTFVRTHLPKPVWEAVKVYGLGLLEMGQPSLQMYIAEHGVRSFVGMNNYFSTLAADIANEAVVELVFHAADGAPLFTHRTRLVHFGSQALDVTALLRARGLDSPRGIVTVRMVPQRRRIPRYQELGLLLSQFFMFYRDEQHGSIAQIHPSSQIDTAATPSPPFLSSQIVATHGLDAVVLYQVQSVITSHRMTLALLDASSRTSVVESVIDVPALGVRRVELAVPAAARPPAILVHASSLPSGNSKPMLQRRFSDGRFSMSHA